MKTINPYYYLIRLGYNKLFVTMLPGGWGLNKRTYNSQPYITTHNKTNTLYKYIYTLTKHLKNRVSKNNEKAKTQVIENQGVCFGVEPMYPILIQYILIYIYNIYTHTKQNKTPQYPMKINNENYIILMKHKALKISALKKRNERKGGGVKIAGVFFVTHISTKVVFLIYIYIINKQK